jgi:SET and MYND domain-containing protein
MSLSLINQLRDALGRMFQSGAERATPLVDILTSRVAASPEFQFQINHTAALGRHAIATHLLVGKPPGTVLLRENSYIWIPTDPGRESVCHLCGLDLAAAHPSRSRRVDCEGCDGQTHYCSVKCRDEHALLHQPICAILRDAPLLADRHHCPPELVRALLSLVAKHATSLHQCAESPNQEMLRSDPLAFEADPEAFSQMLVHPRALDYQSRRSLRALAASICGRLPEEMRPPLELFLTWASQINSNSHGLNRTNAANAFMGFGLFPLGSIFNHSCLPNCTYTNEGPQLVFRLLRPVREGEELCVNYTELYAARDERRTELHATKSFECRCRRCTQSPASEEEASLISAEPMVSAMLCDQTRGCLGLLHQCDLLTDRLGDRSAKWECSVCHACCTYGHLLDTYLKPLRDRLQEAMLLYSHGLTDSTATPIRAAFESLLQSALIRLSASHALVFNCYLPLINCCSALKDYQAKETYARALIEITTATLPDYPPLANYLEAFAQSLNERIQTTPAMPRETRRKYALEAVEALQRSLSICQVCYGTTHPKTLQTSDKLRRAETVAKSR